MGSRFKSLSQMSGARDHHGDLGLGFKLKYDNLLPIFYFNVIVRRCMKVRSVHLPVPGSRQTWVGRCRLNRVKPVLQPVLYLLVSALEATI